MDDKDLEPRTWQEWVDVGTADGGFKFLPARAFCEDKKMWRPCKVMERFRENDTYKCVWADGPEGETEAILPRIAVMFLGEDPFIFARRVATALQVRRNTNQGLMYNLFIDSMPVEGVPMLAPEQLNRVMTLALNTNRVRHKSIDTTGIIDELNFEYSRTMNRVVFDKELESGHQNEMMKGIVAPPLMTVAQRSQDSSSNVPPHDWAQQYCLFNFNSFLTKVCLHDFYAML